MLFFSWILKSLLYFVYFFVLLYFFPDLIEKVINQDFAAITSDYNAVSIFRVRTIYQFSFIFLYILILLGGFTFKINVDIYRD